MNKEKTTTCPQCGTVIESRFRFCGNCGRRIDGGESMDNPNEAAPSSFQETSSSTERATWRNTRTLRLRDCFTFNGRTRRVTFFKVALPISLFVTWFCVVVSTLSNQVGRGTNTIDVTTATILLVVIGIPVFPLCFICLAHQVRRLHDIGLSGFFVLLGLIPVIGWLFLLVADTMDGCSGPNRYGPDPRTRKPNGNAIPWKAMGVLGIELLAWIAIVFVSYKLNHLQYQNCKRVGNVETFSTTYGVVSWILYFVFVMVFWRKVLKKRCITIIDYNCKLSASLLAILGAYSQNVVMEVLLYFCVTGWPQEYFNNSFWVLFSPFVWPLFTLVYPICDMVLTRRRQAKRNQS